MVTDAGSVTGVDTAAGVVTDAGSVTGVGTGAGVVTDACVGTLVEVEVGIAFWSLNCIISQPWILYENIPLFSQIFIK